jgi:hypothetical protein
VRGDISVGIATRYGLEGPASNPGEERFFAPFQTDSGAHTTTYTIVIGSLSRVKRPERGVNHPPSSSTEVKERVELYMYSISGLSWPVMGRSLPLVLYIYNKYSEHRFANTKHITQMHIHLSGLTFY